MSQSPAGQASACRETPRMNGEAGWYSAGIQSRRRRIFLHEMGHKARAEECMALAQSKHARIRRGWRVRAHDSRGERRARADDDSRTRVVHPCVHNVHQPPKYSTKAKKTRAQPRHTIRRTAHQMTPPTYVLRKLSRAAHAAR
jgi:hypothetical protein